MVDSNQDLIQLDGWDHLLEFQLQVVWDEDQEFAFLASLQINVLRDQSPTFWKPWMKLVMPRWGAPSSPAVVSKSMQNDWEWGGRGELQRFFRSDSESWLFLELTKWSWTNYLTSLGLNSNNNIISQVFVWRKIDNKYEITSTGSDVWYAFWTCQFSNSPTVGPPSGESLPTPSHRE